MELRLMDGTICEKCSRVLPGAGPVWYCPCGHKIEGGLTGVESQNEKIKRGGREAWAALHSMQDPTPVKIQEWITTVPQYGCKCADFAVHYTRVNVPPYAGTREEWVEYTWKFHDVVDEKTGDDRMTLEEAKKIWL